MPAAQLLSCRLLSDLPCNGGIELSPAEVPICGNPRPSITESFEGGWVARRVTVSVSRDWRGASSLRSGRILQFRFSDGTGGEVVEEYRIDQDGGAEESTLVQVVAVGVEFDLRERDHYAYQLVAGVPTLDAISDTGTVSELLTRQVLPLCPAYVVLGSITTSTKTVSVSIPGGAMPYEVAAKIIAALKDQVQEVAELWLERNGETNYRLRAGSYNGTLAAADLRTRKNLLTLGYTRPRSSHGNRVQVFGAGGAPLVGQAIYAVDAVVANTSVDVKDVSGGGAPAGEADQYNSLYLLDAAGGTHLIDETQVVSATITRLLMGATSPLAVNDLVRLVRTTSKDLLAWIDSPSLQAADGVIYRKIDAASLGALANLLEPNATMRDWPGALPALWVDGGGTGSIVKDTTVYLTDGQSAKLTATSGNNKHIYREQSFYHLAAASVVQSVWIRLHSAGGGSFTIRFYEGGTEYNTQGPFTQVNTWIRVDAPARSVSAGLRTLRVRCEYSTTNSSSAGWVDSVMAVTGGAVVPFVAGSPPARAVALANAYFQTNGQPRRAYRVSVADRTRLDPRQWPFEGLDLGGSVRIRGTELGVTTIERVVRRDRNPLDGLDTVLEVADRTSDLLLSLAQ